MKLDFHAVTHPGKRRRQNEDAYFAEPPLFIVADGLGGHRAGEIASKEGISRVVNNLNECLEKSEQYSPESVKKCLKNAVISANEALHLLSRQDDELKGMGTTITALYLLPTHMKAVAVHIGDSRLYHQTDRFFQQITKDHTYVQYLLETGQISQEEAPRHPMKNALIQAVGTSRKLRVETHEIDLAQKGTFLLSTDGMHSLIQDDEISLVLKSDRPAAEKITQLLELALERGGLDNITGIVINYQIANET